MLSSILLNHEPHPATFPDLDDVVRSDGIVTCRQLSVDLDPAALDQSSRIAVRPGQTTHNHSPDQADREPGLELRNMLGSLPAAEAAIEILLRALGGFLAVQPAYQGPGQSGFGVPRWELE